MTRSNAKPPETLVQLLEQSAAAHPAAVALRYRPAGGDVWEDTTYRQLTDRARAFAAALVRRGTGGGDRVGILSENRPEWLVASFGTQFARGIDVPIYPTLSAKQVAFVLGHSEARILVVSSLAQLAKVAEIVDTVPSLKKIVVMDPLPEGYETPCRTSVETFERFLAKGQAALEGRPEGQGKDAPPDMVSELASRREALAPGDLASLIYTSGTTGEPKGVMLTHRNLVSNAVTVRDLVRIGPGDCALSFLPLSHVFERVATNALLSVGSTIAYAKSVDTVAADLLEVRPTVFASVPRLFEKIHGRVQDAIAQAPPARQKLFHRAVAVGNAYWAAKDAGQPTWRWALPYRLLDRLVFSKIRARTGGRLRLAVCGGAALPREVARFFRTAGLNIYVGYGLTETSPVVTCNYPGHSRLGSAGLLLPGVRMRLAEDGEILVAGPNVMAGYYKRPDLTEEVITDGWLHTGDVGYQDADGYLFITDRKKELLVLSNGKNVAPTPIENALVASNLVCQAMVVGESRNFVSALLVPEPEQLARLARELGLAGDDVSAWCKDPQVIARFRAEVDERLSDFAHFEKVKAFTLVPREFTQDADELTPTLKFKRRVILDHYRAEVEALYGASGVPSA